MKTSMLLRCLSDPGHGWLEVPLTELAELGIADKITGYSYRKGGMAYLEEDCDADTYFKALKAAGLPTPPVESVYTNDTCPVRSYRGYWEGN